MRVSDKKWVVLFGGAGRQQTVERLIELEIYIEAILVPEKQNARLTRAIDELTAKQLTLTRIPRSSLEASLQKYSGDILLSIGFPYLLPKGVLDEFSLCLNIHPTLLPAYRGPTTGAYIIQNGEEFSGSTVHLLDEGVDSGDIVAQSRVEIDIFDTVVSLQRKVYSSEPDLIEAAIHYLDRGNAPRPQNLSEGSIYPTKRTPEDSKIDPNQKLLDLYNQIRSCDPENYPAYFELDGQRVFIKLWREDSDEDMV